MQSARAEADSSMGQNERGRMVEALGVGYFELLTSALTSVARIPYCRPHNPPFSRATVFASTHELVRATGFKHGGCHAKRGVPVTLPDRVPLVIAGLLLASANAAWAEISHHSRVAWSLSSVVRAMVL